MQALVDVLAEKQCRDLQKSCCTSVRATTVICGREVARGEGLLGDLGFEVRQ